MFVQPGAKINSVYYCHRVFEQGLLLDNHHLSNNDTLFQQDEALVHCYYGFSPGFIISYLSTGQEIGWKDRLRYDLYCVELDVKP